MLHWVPPNFKSTSALIGDADWKIEESWGMMMGVTN